ncbi:MAG: hypothetical protein ACM3OO_13025 [Planctomycetaceae bacterium]
MAMMTALNQPRFTAVEMAELEQRARQRAEMRDRRRTEHEVRERRAVRLRRLARTPQLAPAT